MELKKVDESNSWHSLSETAKFRRIIFFIYNYSSQVIVD
jgi:hypothetical protein